MQSHKPSEASGVACGMFDQSVRVLAPHSTLVLGHMRRINDSGIVMGCGGLAWTYGNKRGIVKDLHRRSGRLDVHGLADKLVGNSIIPAFDIHTIVALAPNTHLEGTLVVARLW